MMLPLAVVLLATMIKEAIEDYRKYQYDKTINFTKMRVYGKWKLEWKRQPWTSYISTLLSTIWEFLWTMELF
ncbi:hypothetical protein Nmel_014142 [Mimus melanotis]